MCTFKRGGATLEDTNKKIHELQAPPIIVTRDTDSRFTEHFRGGGQKKNGDGGNGSKGVITTATMIHPHISRVTYMGYQGVG